LPPAFRVSFRTTGLPQVWRADVPAPRFQEDSNMNRHISWATGALVLACAIAGSGCFEVATKPRFQTNIDPADHELLARAISIAGAKRLTGNLPPPSKAAGAPRLVGSFASSSTSQGGVAIIPLNFVTGSSGIAGYLVKLPGSSIYYRVPNAAPVGSGQFILPIGIPSVIAEGEFPITYCVIDSSGQVGNVLETQIVITLPSRCDVTTNSGGEGTTSTVHALGAAPGTVNISYETYSVPDRIDVYYHGQWVTGMGPDPQGWPQLDDCSDVGPGYRGEHGVLTFNYAPVGGDYNILVVVSGCLGGGTAWDYSVGCPGAAPPPFAAYTGTDREGGMIR
jgi:hypothetical protein